MSALLEVSGVSVSFDGFKAINNLSFEIGPAELRAVIGPNGAGKTTFMDIVTGKTRPDEGRVLWGERSVLAVAAGRGGDRPAGDRAQVPAPDGVRGPVGARQPDDGAEQGPRPVRVLFYWNNAADEARVRDLAAEIGLSNELARKSGELSHGQKQWLEIGMLLAQDPKLLLVDEPAAGMTPEEREHTTALLVEAAKTRAVVVVEHDMEFVRRLDCKVTVLHEGSVLAEGSLDHVTANPEVIEVYLGR